MIKNILLLTTVLTVSSSATEKASTAIFSTAKVQTPNSKQGQALTKSIIQTGTFDHSKEIETHQNETSNTEEDDLDELDEIINREDDINEHATLSLRRAHSSNNGTYSALEAKQLSIKFINNLNFSSPKRLHEITKILMLRGIHSENPIKKVLKAYRFYLTDGIKTYGLDESHFDSEIKETIKSALNYIEIEGFETYIKPEIKKIEDQALRIQRNHEYTLYLEQDTETDSKNE